MNEIEYSIEFERLLNHYRLKRNRVRAYAIEKYHLSMYDIAEHLNLSHTQVFRHLQ